MAGRWLTRRRVVVAGGVLLGAALLVLIAIRLPAVQDVMMRRGMEGRFGRDIGDVLGDDVVTVLVCGSGSPLPGPDRAQACVAVFAGGHAYVFDVGAGAAANFARWLAPADRVEHVFLTHFHSDHFGGLADLSLNGWVAGRPGPLAVHGPPGVERVVAGLEEAYALDREYRTQHHGAELLPPEAGRLSASPFEPAAEAQIVFEEGEITIRAFLVEHDPVVPAVGYRLDYRGRSVVISGDTVRSANLVAAARDADLLLHEALAPHVVKTIEEVTRTADQPRLAKVMLDIPDYHASPVDAAHVANEANVRRLVLYHLVPGPSSGIAQDAFLRDVSRVRGDVTLAHDGAVYALPVGTDAIHERSL